MDALLKVASLFDRPRNALFTGAKHYADAVNAGLQHQIPAWQRFLPLSELSGALFSKPFWQGAYRGLTGQEHVGGADVIQHDYPQFAENHPTATSVLGAGLEIAGDPTLIGGAMPAGEKIMAAVPKAAAAVATLAPEAGAALDLAAKPALQQIGKAIAPIIRFGKPGAIQNFLRVARSKVSIAGSDAAESAVKLGEGLGPEEEAAARRLMERPADAAVRERIAARTGGAVPSAVDVALNESGQQVAQDTLRGVPKARVFRAVNPADAQLDEVMSTAQQAQDYVNERLAQVPEGRRFRLGDVGQRQLNEVMTAARNAPIDTETTVTNARQAREYLQGTFGASRAEVAALSDAEAVNLALEAQQSRTLPDALQRVERAARERGLTAERVFNEAQETPAERLRRLAARANLRTVAGFAKEPTLARPDTLKPRAPSAWEIVQRAAQAQGKDADTLFAQSQASPIGFLRDRAMTPSQLHWSQVGGAETRSLPKLARPATLIPSAVDEAAVNRAAIDKLMQYGGMSENVANAAVQGRRLTNQIVQTAQEHGLPLEGRKEYFPRVTAPDTSVLKNPVQAIKDRINRGFFGGRDANAEARTLAPEMSIDELATMRKQGKEIPNYREDFAIPLAVRSQRAAEAVAAHTSIQEGFERFGQALGNRSPQELAKEGLVAVKYVPKNSNQPFQLARSVMPEDPDSWVAIPRELAQGLQAFHQQFVTDQGLEQMATIWNTLHNAWKFSVTGIRPAFYLNNGIGGLVNNLLQGVTSPDAYVNALKAVSGKSGYLEIPIGLNGATNRIAYADALRMMQEQGVTHSTLNRNLFKTSSLGDLTGQKGFFGRMADAGAKVEQFNRASIFFDRLMKGASAAEAAGDTLAAHFDYSNEALTQAEQKLRQFAPFYVWLKNNAEFQAKKFLEKPQVYAAYARARDTLSEPGREERPDYQAHAIPTGIKIGDKSIVWQSNDPIQDAFDMLERPGDKFGGLATPLIKEPIQQGMNYDTFTEQPIQSFPGQLGKFAGAYMPVRAEHILRNLTGAAGQVANAAGNVATGAGSLKDAAAMARFFVPGLQVADPQAAMRENVFQLRKAAQDRRALLRQNMKIEAEKAQR